MQDDAQLALRVLLVAKAFVDSGDGPVFVGQLDPPHPHRDIALNEAGRGDALHCAPAHDREPFVQWVVCRMAAEIGHCAGSRGAECLLTACHCRFEQNRPKVVAIVIVETV